jgi:8-oxo-dGTP diphosphatase
MPREISAGGLVVRRMRGGAFLAAIRPAGRPEGYWALPKGLVDRGEEPLAAALREVREETGLEAAAVARLDDLRYVYTRDGVRIFKVVSFWLMRPLRGRLGAIDEAMRVEVADAAWLPLARAPELLAHRGERQLAERLRDAPGAAAPAAKPL